VKVAAVADDIRAWVVETDLQARDRDEVAEIVYKAQEFQGPMYYALAKVSWGNLRWEKRQVSLDAQGELRTLYRELRELRN
jgi:hypothetical protein